MNGEALVCIYCGSNQDVTDDHVPPKNIFPPPRPSDLITVPGCRKCNGGASKDDEVFRLLLSLRADSGEHPDARANWDPIFRSLARPQATGLAKSVLAGLRPVEVRTAGGLFVGTALGYTVDLERVYRVVRRTVRGLIFHETRRRPPADDAVAVYSDDILVKQDPILLANWTTNIIEPLAQVPPKVIGSGTFQYRYLFAEGNPEVSAWGLSFFRTISFLALVIPQAALPHRKDAPDDSPTGPDGNAGTMPTGRRE